MATQRVCDICGKAKDSVRQVEAHLVLGDSVAPGQTTGTSAAIDACDECRDAAQDFLAGEVKAQLAEELPEHVRMYDERVAIEQLPKEERDAAQAAADDRRTKANEAITASREARQTKNLAKAKKAVANG